MKGLASGLITEVSKVWAPVRAMVGLDEKD